MIRFLDYLISDGQSVKIYLRYNEVKCDFILNSEKIANFNGIDGAYVIGNEVYSIDQGGELIRVSSVSA